MSKHINIVSFDIPFPANYGGVMDVYYKLFWLKKDGIKIHLHCFAYGRSPAKELEDLCEEVFYYERKTGLVSNVSFLPYNVKSRQSEDLAKNLLKNDHPILFEVLHTCSLMADPRFKSRKKIYRHSNIEHDYYNGLAASEKPNFKKLYLRIEAIKLRSFEKILNYADLILAVNQKDTEYFKTKYPQAKSFFLPSFHPNESIAASHLFKDYVLFHGNLSVSENHEAAQWLIEQVFCKIGQTVVIAGLNPSSELKRLINKYPQISLISSPETDQMDQLISNAKLHVLYTSQATGLKLKLLNVLFKGGFVLCNSAMIEGTGLKENASLKIANSALDFIDQINTLMKMDYTDVMRHEREQALLEFKNESNAEKLIDLVFSESNF